MLYDNIAWAMNAHTPAWTFVPFILLLKIGRFLVKDKTKRFKKSMSVEQAKQPNDLAKIV